MLIYMQIIETPAERSKFEILYRQYRDLLYRVAFSILKNPQDAEDALHHAFMKIAENIKKINDPMCLKTKSYAVTIVRNAAIDIYRDKKAHPKVDLLDGTTGLTVEYNGNNRLAACMMKLTERQRTVLLLKHYHGFDTREVAKMIGISYRNALQIEQRAKAKLRALCEEEGIEC